MKPSIVLLGQSKESEAPLSRFLGGDAQRFFILGQRILWGSDQSDLVRVDVPRTVEKLVKHYGDAPVAHALAAYGLRKSDRAAADQAMQRAWEIAGDEHAHSHLLPSPDEWEGKKPNQSLECVIPDRVWRVTSYDAVTGLDLARDNIATFVRTEDAGLVCINPVKMEEEVIESVSKLGEMGAIVVQGKGHSRGLPPTATLFPGATTYATRAHESHPASADLKFDKHLDDQSPSSELIVKSVAGTALEELVLVHRPTRLAIAQDLFRGNFRGQPQSFASRLYAFCFGLDERVGMLGIQIFLINDWELFARGLADIGSEKPERLVGAHHDMVEGEELQGLFDTIDFAQKLRGKDHKRMLLRYFARQPGFLRDLIKYKRAQKRARANP
jgi:hypothetical protein